MAELVHLRGNTYYIKCPTNIGLYAEGGRAILIDSGNDKDRARKVLSILKEKGLRLELIINTHSNADHIGGNAYLQSETGSRIAATALEKPFIENPKLEPSFLYGGFPLPALRKKFLMAEDSLVTDTIKGSGRILDTGLDAIGLPGHFFEMIGVRTPDDVVFIADSIFSPEVITKYPLIFIYDVKAFLETLDILYSMKASIFVLSHGGPATDIRNLVESNRQAVLSAISRIVSLCDGRSTDEDILAKLYPPSNETEYALNLCTLRSYLSYLSGSELECSISHGRLYWNRKK